MMADEKKQFEEDEEYQFGDKPSSSQYSAESAKLPSPPSSGFRRVGMLAVGLVIVVFAVYKMMGVFFSGPVAKKSGPASVTMNQAMQPAPMIPKPTTMEQALPLPQQQSVTSELDTKIAALESAVQTNKNDMAQITSNMGSVNQSLLTVNEKLSTVMNTLDRLSADLDAQKAKLEQQAKKKVMKRGGHHGLKAYSPPVQYFLQAVVPGRAWIMTSGGKPITVREGSVIPGHGRVRTIDANQGIVTTTNGSVIRFHPSES